MAAVQSRFFPEKSGNAAVAGCNIKEKNCRQIPIDMTLGENSRLKDKTLEAKSVKSQTQRDLIPQRQLVYADFLPSDMSLGKILPPWHQFLDQKIRGAHFSLGIVAGERFAIELTPSTFPQRQRHVAGEKVGMLLGKASNVVVKGYPGDNVSLGPRRIEGSEAAKDPHPIHPIDEFYLAFVNSLSALTKGEKRSSEGAGIVPMLGAFISQERLKDTKDCWFNNSEGKSALDECCLLKSERKQRNKRKVAVLLGLTEDDKEAVKDATKGSLKWCKFTMRKQRDPYRVKGLKIKWVGIAVGLLM
ncbi:hypothetical protein Tco_0696578 [Tanacetum coccineum]